MQAMYKTLRQLSQGGGSFEGLDATYNVVKRELETINELVFNAAEHQNIYDVHYATYALNDPQTRLLVRILKMPPNQLGVKFERVWDPNARMTKTILHIYWGPA